MEIISQTIAVFAVLALLAAALWWLRRKGYAAFAGAGARLKSARRMELVERLQLTPQHSLHLVRLGEASILVAIFPSGCTVIERLSSVPAADRRRDLTAEKVG